MKKNPKKTKQPLVLALSFTQSIIKRQDIKMADSINMAKAVA